MSITTEADNKPKVAMTGIWRKPINTSVVVAVIVLMVLNLVDFFSTLYAVSYLGAEEMNPVMDKLLAQGPFSFFIVKYLMIAICAIGIAVCCHKTRAARWVLFGVALPMYVGVCIYQIHFLLVG